MIIYEAVNKINGKRYIGQTIQKLNDRKRQHLESINYNHKGCTLFKRALKKYGKSNFEWKIVDHASSHEELDLKESFWIGFFNTTNSDFGYNLKGGGAKPYLTQEVKDAIGNAQKGSFNHMYGRRGRDNPSSRPVIILETGETFGSVLELCRVYPQFSNSKVCAVCRGTRYTHKKHTFRYLDENGVIIDNGIPTDIVDVNKLKHEHVSKNANSIKLVDLTNNIVYDSVVKAVGDKKHKLYQALKRHNGECICDGIHWKII